MAWKHSWAAAIGVLAWLYASGWCATVMLQSVMRRVWLCLMASVSDVVLCCCHGDVVLCCCVTCWSCFSSTVVCANAGRWFTVAFNRSCVSDVGVIYKKKSTTTERKNKHSAHKHTHMVNRKTRDIHCTALNDQHHPRSLNVHASSNTAQQSKADQGSVPDSPRQCQQSAADPGSSVGLDQESQTQSKAVPDSFRRPGSLRLIAGSVSRGRWPHQATQSTNYGTFVWLRHTLGNHDVWMDCAVLYCLSCLLFVYVHHPTRETKKVIQQDQTTQQHHSTSTTMSLHVCFFDVLLAAVTGWCLVAFVVCVCVLAERTSFCTICT